MGCCGLGGPLYVLLSVANAAACLAFLAFSIECSMIHGEPVETCYDSFLAYREVNKAMLGTLFGLHVLCCALFLWLCRGVGIGPMRHVRRALGDPGARLYEGIMWLVTCAMIAYIGWALGSEGVYAMAAIIIASVLCNSATTSYIAPMDLSERLVIDARERDIEHDPLAAASDGGCAGRPGYGCGPSPPSSPSSSASSSPAYDPYYDYSDEDDYAADYAAVATTGAIQASDKPPSGGKRPRRPRPGRMRSAAMRTLLLNLFLHNAVLFLYDVTSVLARLDDPEMAPVARRALVLSNLASVWYRGGQALFFYYKYNFAWRNVMIPQFEPAPITSSATRW